ncbi:MAG: ATP-dependent RNA helicase SrmB [Sodalis sp. (in: enterobacteria)]
MNVTRFSELELHENLLIALRDKGFVCPTAIQTIAIPAIIDGRDVLGSAPTGTGKTAAYLLPILQNLLNFPRKKSGPPRVLILTPTRELAMQVAEQARQLASHTHLDIATITGGVAYMNHAAIFIKNQDVVVATTGRLLQYIKEKNFSCRAIETLILDEADRMLDMGFSKDILQITAKISYCKQTLLFSATLENYKVNDFAKHLMKNPVKIDVSSSHYCEHKKITQYYYCADNLTHKIALLCHFLKQPDVKKSIVFVRKRKRLHELISCLHDARIPSYYLEGEMVQSKRNQAISRMIDGRINVLVATDVASRGLDINNISHVINFDLPSTPDVYLHRIGRTARAGRPGCAISLVEAHDNFLLGKINHSLNEPLKARTIKKLRSTTRAPSEKMAGKPSKQILRRRREKKEKICLKNKTKMRLHAKKNIGKRRLPKTAQN